MKQRDNIPDRPEHYWFMRMRVGSEGDDYCESMWKGGQIGILFGHWTVEDVLDAKSGVPSEKRLMSSSVKKKFPRNAVRKQEVKRLARWTQQASSFLFRMQEGDHVFVCSEQSIHCARVGNRYFTGESVKTADGDTETFKCRTITDQKGFALGDLPCVFRLLQNTGRQTIQQIRSGKRLARILVNSSSPNEVRDQMRSVPEDEFLGLLSDKGWETICLEYLRCRLGFRLLTFLPGVTLPHVDLVGIDEHGHRVLAQCKNNEDSVSERGVRDWLRLCGRTKQGERLVYCARAGVDHAETIAHDNPAFVSVSGDEVLRWLRDDPVYFEALKLI